MATDPYKYFRVEARDLVEQLVKHVLALERSFSPAELVAQILRLAHTLKGAARVVKQQRMADRAHAIEELLAPFRESTIPPDARAVGAVLKELDQLTGAVAELDRAPASSGSTPPARPAAEDVPRTVIAELGEMDALLEGLAETHTLLGALARGAAEVERGRRLAELLVEQLAAPGSRDLSRNAATANKIRSIASDLRSIFGSVERSLGSGLERIDRELRQLRDTAEQLRLVNVSTLFISLERTTRDVAAAQGKRVSFEARGGDVRLDAHVLSAIRGALVQIFRNAVAHGIESEEQRLLLGKPAEGRVMLAVARRGRRVIFTCTDDGAGVDLDAVRLAAQRKGILRPDLQSLGPEELLGLLLHGGISTSIAVTGVSGRGIGLDVVRDATERIGGTLVVHTERDRGTTIELSVPLSVASLEGLLVDVAGSSVVIPLDAVERTVRVTSADIAASGRGESLVVGDRSVPYFALARSMMPHVATAPRTAIAVILKSSRGKSAAVGVDRLLGISSVVLRPLPELAPAEASIAGACFDSDGNPRLVIDPDGVVAHAERAVAPQSTPSISRKPVLVIDDSLTTRMLEKSILESAGYEVEVATSAEEGLEKAEALSYGAFIVDVEMPGMNGFEFIERTRAHPVLRDVPSILVTSRASPEDRRRGREVGARAYVVKGEFDQRELLEYIATLVG